MGYTRLLFAPVYIWLTRITFVKLKSYTCISCLNEENETLQLSFVVFFFSSNFMWNEMNKMFTTLFTINNSILFKNCFDYNNSFKIIQTVRTLLSHIITTKCTTLLHRNLHMMTINQSHSYCFQTQSARKQIMCSLMCPQIKIIF